MATTPDISRNTPLDVHIPSKSRSGGGSGGPFNPMPGDGSGNIAVELTSGGNNFSLRLTGDATLQNPTDAQAGQEFNIDISRLGGQTLSFGDAYVGLDNIDLPSAAGVGGYLRGVVVSTSPLKVYVFMQHKLESGLDAATVELLTAMVTPPNDGQVVAINSLIVAFKAAGVWDALSDIYVFRANAEQSALLNWKSPSTTATLGNGPTFIAKDCIRFTASNQYVRTRSFGSGSLYTQNNASVHLGYSAAINPTRILNNATGPGHTRVEIGSTNIQTIINSSATRVSSPMNYAGGLLSLNRVSAADYTVLLDGTLIATVAEVSTGVPTGNVDSPVTAQVGSEIHFMGYGAGMTQSATKQLAQALNTYYHTFILT